MTAHGAGDLWLGDDPMPSCDPCMDGDHAGCSDVLWHPSFGSFACDCRNPLCADPEED